MKFIFLILCLVASVACVSVKLETHRVSGGIAKFRNLKRASLAKGTQSIQDNTNTVYVTKVQFGTPPQILSLLIDTGSADTWVVDKRCRSQACDMFPDAKYYRAFFNSNASSTFMNTTLLHFVSNEDYGKVSGLGGNDTMRLGGLIVKHQGFGLINQMDDAYGYEPFDGYLGLGFPSLSLNGITPPMQNLLPQLDKKVFTIWYDKVAKGITNGTAGQITIGDFDNVNCDSKINYVPILNTGYWQFNFQGFSIGTYTDSNTYSAIADSGKANIAAPNPIFRAIIRQIGATFDGDTFTYIVPCSKMNTLPNLVLNVNGLKLSIPPVQYVLDLGYGNDKCEIAFEDGGFPDSHGNMPAWKLGDVFVRTYCNIHDIGSNQLGFALAKHK